LTNENKLILKQLIDQNVIQPDQEAIELIDFFFQKTLFSIQVINGKHEFPHYQGLTDIVTDELIDNFKAVKLNNVLQIRLLKDKIKAEHEAN
jgi:hypothetical protein